MKQGKNPTAAQKAWLTNHDFNPKDWLVVLWSAERVTIVHKKTREVKNITP